MPGSLPRSFPSAFDRLDCESITAADIVKFHRSVFGDLRMENDPAPTDPPAPTPPAPTPPPVPTPPAPTDPPTGFPADTPLTEMTVEQREAYWKHQARKHESRANARADYDTVKAERDQLKQSVETETEKAVREAREAGASDARQAAANETVAAMLRMGLRARGIDGDDLTEVVSTINLAAHANDKGEVDDEMVLRTVNRLAGTAGGSAGPDTGQGNRGGQTRKSGVSAGAELFAASRGKTTTNT